MVIIRIIKHASHGLPTAWVLPFRRRTVFTKDGRFAVAPMSTKTSDQIWILGGSLVPVILKRVSEGRYNLVGQAFVYGVMHGEAVDGTKELGSILLV